MWDTATIGGRASYHKKDLAGARILPRNVKHHLCLILVLDIYLLHDLALKHVPYSTMMESLSQIYVVDSEFFPLSHTRKKRNVPLFIQEPCSNISVLLILLYI